MSHHAAPIPVTTASRAAPSAIESYVPASFLARGTAVAFTTPQLAGARVRPGPRDRLELILPNPSGKSGVYVVPWQEIGSACRLGVHDGWLAARIGRLRSITPAAIRDLTREVAAEGLAGREAMAAARAAVIRDAALWAVREAELMQALAEQHGPPSQASLLGLPPEAIATALSQLARSFIGSGVAGAGSDRAPIAHELAALAQLRREVAAHAAGHPEDDAGPLLHLSALTLFCADAALRETQRQAGDVLGLLRRWQSGREALVQFLARPDWLLDGWAHIRALWRNAKPDQRGTALMEMTNVMPVLPTEAEAWVAAPLDLKGQLVRGPGRTALRQDWRASATSHDQIARNEALLAATL